jgi:hypothetical protein
MALGMMVMMKLLSMVTVEVVVFEIVENWTDK